MVQPTAYLKYLTQTNVARVACLALQEGQCTHDAIQDGPNLALVESLMLDDLGVLSQRLHRVVEVQVEPQMREDPLCVLLQENAVDGEEVWVVIIGSFFYVLVQQTFCLLGRSIKTCFQENEPIILQ